MLKLQKQQLINELQIICEQSDSIVIFHYHGLTVAKLTLLRKNLRANNSQLRIVKNTLSKIAANKVNLPSIDNLLVGPTAIAYSKDPVLAAKTVVEFSKTNEQLKVIGGVVNNQVLDKREVQSLADLPSLDELRGKIVGLIQGPAAKLVRMLNAPATQLARALQAHIDKV